MRGFWKTNGRNLSRILRLAANWTKAVLFCFLFCYTCFHGIPFLLYGDHVCTRLLSQDFEIGRNYWRFLRCMSARSPKEFRNRRIGDSNTLITFIGDERHYWRFKSFQSVFGGHTQKHMLPKMCYFRQEYINSTFLDIIESWTTGNSSASRDHLLEKAENCAHVMPTHLVLGLPLIPCCSDGREISTESPEVNETKLVQILHRMANIRVLWVKQDCTDSWCSCSNSSSLRQRLQLHNPENLKTLKPSRNIGFFQASRSISVAHGLQDSQRICRGKQNSASYVSYFYKTATLDGRLIPYALFNVGSKCCMLPKLNSIQKRLFIIFSSAAILAAVFGIFKLFLRSKAIHSWICPSMSKNEDSAKLGVLNWCHLFFEIFGLVSKFGLILLYYFIRERTVIYERKYSGYTYWGFVGTVLFLVLIGVLSVQPSNLNTFNNLDITREWKGWMQLYIVIYHYQPCHAVPAYSVARMVISSYLFLSGYGHFCYYWKQKRATYSVLGLLKFQKSDVQNFGRSLWEDIERYLNVIFRLNLVFIAVCLSVNDGLHHHYYMQLATTWYTALTVVMICFPRVSSHSLQNQIIPRVNASLLGESHEGSNTNVTPDCRNSQQNCTLPKPICAFNRRVLKIVATTFHQYHQQVMYAVYLGKLALLAWISDKICRNRALFNTIFFSGPLKNYFNSFPNHWYWRFKNDAFTAIYGAAFALACEIYFRSKPKQAKTLTECRRSSGTCKCCSSSSYNISKIFVKIKEPWRTSLFVTVAGILTLVASVKIYFLCTTHECVDDLNKYICFIPILSYIALRNGLPFMRNHCSTFFVRIGYITMELYIVHLMGTGTFLVLYFPVHDFVNAFIEALHFFCMCDELQQLSAQLINYFLPKKPFEILWKFPLALFMYCFVTSKI